MVSSMGVDIHLGITAIVVAIVVAAIVVAIVVAAIIVAIVVVLVPGIIVLGNLVMMIHLRILTLLFSLAGVRLVGRDLPGHRSRGKGLRGQ